MRPAHLSLSWPDLLNQSTLLAKWELYPVYLFAWQSDSENQNVVWFMIVKDVNSFGILSDQGWKRMGQSVVLRWQEKYAAASELFLEQRTCCLFIYFLKRSSAGEMESAVKLYSPGKEQESKLVKCLAEWALLQKFLIIMTFWFDLYVTGKKLSVQKLAALAFAKRAGN